MLLQLGLVPTLVVSSADQARDIFKHHDLALSGRPELYVLKKMCYNLSCVSSAPYGDYWREARRILVLELMTARRVDSFRSTRVEEVGRMIERIARAGPEPVNLSVAVFAYSNNFVSRAVLGVADDVDSGRFQKIFKELQHLVAEFNVADFFPGLGWINRINGVDRRVDHNFRDLDSFFQKLIEEHRRKAESESESEDFIDVLLRVQRNSGLTDEQLKGVLLDVFVGGTDTSATTIVWIMTELMKNPSARRKAEQEVREMAKGKSRVAESDLPNLKYLKQVIKESFRLHPPAPLLVPRETTEPCIIADKFEIPANTRVFFNVSAMASDPAVWDNPEEFRPERFEESRVDFKGQHFELLPFNLAPGDGAARVSASQLRWWSWPWRIFSSALIGSFQKELMMLIWKKRLGLLCIRRILFAWWLLLWSSMARKYDQDLLEEMAMAMTAWMHNHSLLPKGLVQLESCMLTKMKNLLKNQKGIC